MNDEEAIAELKAYLKRNGDAGVEVLVEQLRKLKAFELQSLRSRQPDREAVIEEAVAVAHEIAKEFRREQHTWNGPLNKESRDCCSWKHDGAMAVVRALKRSALSTEAGAFAEADRIMAKTDAEVRVEAIAEFGSEEAALAAAADLKAKMLATVDAHIAAKAAAPTPDPAVMRDYIIRLTRFFIDRPEWVALAEEARGYVGDLSTEDSNG